MRGGWQDERRDRSDTRARVCGWAWETTYGGGAGAAGSRGAGGDRSVLSSTAAARPNRHRACRTASPPGGQQRSRRRRTGSDPGRERHRPGDRIGPPSTVTALPGRGAPPPHRGPGRRCRSVRCGLAVRGAARRRAGGLPDGGDVGVPPPPRGTACGGHLQCRNWFPICPGNGHRRRAARRATRTHRLTPTRHSRQELPRRIRCEEPCTVVTNGCCRANEAAVPPDGPVPACEGVEPWGAAEQRPSRRRWPGSSSTALPPRISKLCNESCRAATAAATVTATVMGTAARTLTPTSTTNTAAEANLSQNRGCSPRSSARWELFDAPSAVTSRALRAPPRTHARPRRAGGPARRP